MSRFRWSASCKKPDRYIARSGVHNCFQDYAQRNATTLAGLLDA
ncbi:hypothetical protein [Micromonospora sp. NPDC005313]